MKNRINKVEDTSADFWLFWSDQLRVEFASYEQSTNFQSTNGASKCKFGASISSQLTLNAVGRCCRIYQCATHFSEVQVPSWDGLIAHFMLGEMSGPGTSPTFLFFLFFNPPSLAPLYHRNKKKFVDFFEMNNFTSQHFFVSCMVWPETTVFYFL